MMAEPIIFNNTKVIWCKPVNPCLLLFWVSDSLALPRPNYRVLYFKPLNLQHFTGSECYFLVWGTAHADSHWDLLLQYDFLKGKKAKEAIHNILRWKLFLFLCHHWTPSCCTSQNRNVNKTQRFFTTPHSGNIGLPFQSSLSEAVCVHCCEKRQKCI